MKALVRKTDGVIVFYAEQVESLENGIRVDGMAIFTEPLDVFEAGTVDESDRRQPQAKRIVNGEIVSNPDYVPYKSAEEKLSDAEKEIEALKRMIQQMNDDNLAFMEDVLGMLNG